MFIFSRGLKANGSCGFFCGFKGNPASFLRDKPGVWLVLEANQKERTTSCWVPKENRPPQKETKSKHKNDKPKNTTLTMGVWVFGKCMVWATKRITLVVPLV